MRKFSKILLRFGGSSTSVLKFNKYYTNYENSNFTLCKVGTENIFKGIKGYSKIKVKISKKPFKDCKSFKFLGKGRLGLKGLADECGYVYMFRDAESHLEALGITLGKVFHINITGVK